MNKVWIQDAQKAISEKQLEIERMQLEVNAYKEQLDSETTKELSTRLNELHKEYSLLKQQVAAICANNEIYEQIACANKRQATQAAEQAHSESQRQKDSIQTPTHHSVAQQRQKTTNKQRAAQQRAPRQKKDLEKTLGKSVMGIMASVLIFVALIMFAIVALPSMTDTIKMIAMFAISGGITGIGVMLMKKDQHNAFNASIAGCGIGAIFISLMTTRMYFNAINDYVLYLALLIWAAAVAFFSKDKHKIFVIIAEVGISVATIIGLAGVFADNSAADIKANMLVAFALLSEAAIYCFNHTKDMKNDNFMHIPHAIRAIVMVFIFVIMTAGSVISYIPLTMVLFIVAGLFAIHRSSEEPISKNVLLVSYVLPISLIICSLVGTLCKNLSTAEPYILFVTMAVVFTTYIFIHNKYKYAVGASHVALVSCAIYFMDTVAYHETFSIMAVFVPAALLLLPTLIMSYRTNELYWKWLGAGLPMFISMFWWDMGGIGDVGVLIGFIIMLLFIATNFKILSGDKDDHVRIGLYIASMILIPLQLGDIVSCWNVESDVVEAILENIALACAYLPAVLLYLYVDKKRWLTRHVDISVLQNVLMGALILFGSLALHDGANIYRYDVGSAARDMGITMYNIQSWIIGLLLIGLNVMRTMTMLRKGKGYGIGISAAYLVSMWAIITRLSAINYIVSIAMLLLAIGMIIIGFKIKVEDIIGNKEMRLFGLVLSMIVTIKLLMFDIEHDNLLETSGYLLLAGVLCFAISFAYNRLDKSLGAERIAVDSKDADLIEENN